MSILLTGGLGYIGSHTAVELLNRNKDVIIVDDLSNSKIEVVDKLKKITGKDFKFIKADLKDFAITEEIFKTNKIDSIVHFAGYKAVGESVAKPIMYYENNLISTLNLLKCMEKYNVNNLVFSSSATVYGVNQEMPLKEDFPTGATNPYGRTKLFIEEILKDASVANQNLNIAILRYFNPIGAHESSLIGEDPNGIPNNLMPYITKVATGKLEKLSIFGNDYPTKDGTGVRDYIHVVDLAVGHKEFVLDVNAHDLADDDVCGADSAVAGKADGLEILALKLDGRFGNTIGLYKVGGCFCKTCLFEFINAIFKACGGDVHCFAKVVCNHIIYKLACLFDVSGCVFSL